MTTQDQTSAMRAAFAEIEARQAEEGKRAQVAAEARHSQQMEGGDVSAYARDLQAQFVAGTLSAQDMTRLLLAHHGLPER